MCNSPVTSDMPPSYIRQSIFLCLLEVERHLTLKLLKCPKEWPEFGLLHSAIHGINKLHCPVIQNSILARWPLFSGHWAKAMLSFCLFAWFENN